LDSPKYYQKNYFTINFKDKIEPEDFLWCGSQLMMWLNHNEPLGVWESRFIFELKNSIFDKFKKEESLSKILRSKLHSVSVSSPSILIQHEKHSQGKNFLTKLLQFLKKLSPRNRKKIILEIGFEEIPVAIITAS
jgi:hypothetical protein